MWLKEFNRYLCNIENFAYGEINERNFSNPHPCFEGLKHCVWQLWLNGIEQSVSGIILGMG